MRESDSGDLVVGKRFFSVILVVCAFFCCDGVWCFVRFVYFVCFAVSICFKFFCSVSE